MLSAVGLGAVGGMVVEAVNLYGRITGWQNARHAARGRKGAQLPALDRYIDVPDDSLVAVTRLLMGAAAGLLFHSEVTGAPAVAVGACAPALLRQLGASRSIGDIALGQDGPYRAPDERPTEVATDSSGASEGSSLPSTATPSVEPAQ
ncbi:MAG TPA: hypothetical protein VGX23_19900 [Actinocrinis sp.]|nr:hypothetical protein [Actinocrinis sp.]